MNQNSLNAPRKWHSKGKTISQCLSHKDLFIVDHEDGTFHSVSSSVDIMLAKYPENSKAVPRDLRMSAAYVNRVNRN